MSRPALPSPAMIVACLALFVALGGTGYAATQISTGKGGAVASKSKAKRGPRGPRGPAGAAGTAGAAGLNGRDGVNGKDGTAGATGPTGSTGVVTVKSFSGLATAIPASGSLIAFYGGTTSVTLTSATQRLTGSAVVPLATASGSAEVAADLCYQLGAGPIIRFNGGNFTIPIVTSARVDVSVSGSVVPGAAGTYTVGFCATNNSVTTAVDHNDFSTGWVMVTN